MIYDITQPIDNSLAVWPGDVPVTREITGHIERGDHSTTSAIHATVHLGTHVDAPSHYAGNGQPVDQRALDYYIGRCQVVTVEVKRGERITWDHIKAPIGAERVLIRTGTFPDPTSFHEDFAGLTPKLIGALGREGVKLVGIDTPSVDLFGDEDMPSHKAFLEHDMAILEWIDLTNVPDGFYELIALPLRLVGYDASPVRAILRTLE